MRVGVLFDKEAVREGLRTGWGFSLLAEGKILFDTGQDGEMLAENLDRLRIRCDDIEAVVISHEHYDHTGGLWEALQRKRGLAVYICPAVSRGFREKIEEAAGRPVDVAAAVEIVKDIFAVGGMECLYKGSGLCEQALVVRTANGLTVVTGCAHPGIVGMVERVRAAFPGERLYAVIGGFHLKDKDEGFVRTVVRRFQEMGVVRAGPTHCSGPHAERLFRAAYGDRFIRLGAGSVIEV